MICKYNTLKRLFSVNLKHNYNKIINGKPNTFEYAVYAKNDEKKISYWHVFYLYYKDISLNYNENKNLLSHQPFICEIPRGYLLLLFFKVNKLNMKLIKKKYIILLNKILKKEN